MQHVDPNEPPGYPSGCRACEAGKYASIETELNLDRQASGGTRPRECRDCADGQLQPFSNQSRCEPCPTDGSIVCFIKNEVRVAPRYYLPSVTITDAANPNALAIDLRTGLCPMADACLGGNRTGEASCSEGYYGPLCGSCRRRYYRSVKACERCPASNLGRSIGAYISFAVLAFASVLLYFASAIDALPHAVPTRNSRRRRWRRWVRKELPSVYRLFRRSSKVAESLSTRRVLRQAATLTKIFLGYGQCLVVFRRFDQV